MGNRINSLPATSVVLALAIASLTACGPDGSSSGATASSPAPTPTSAPTPTPTPTPAGPTAQFAAPFGLTASRALDVFGFQSPPTGPSAPATGVGFRWNAQSSSYELMMPGYAWARLTVSSPGSYEVYADAVKQPFGAILQLGPTNQGLPDNVATPHYAHRASIFGTGGSALFAFGLFAAAGEVPLTGTRTCSYDIDDDGTGTLVLDLATGNLTGHLKDFYGPDYTLPPTHFTPGSTTFTATGPLGPIDGQFFGPGAQEVAVRWTSKTTDPNLNFNKVWVMICTQP
jgi:hypothetical protein